jgi:hypothetical protein
MRTCIQRLMYEYAHIFIKKYFKVCLLAILYNANMNNREFGQSYCNDLLKRIIKKFILYFFIFILFSMHFRSLYIFSGNSKPKMKSEFGKIGRIVIGHNLARDHGPIDQSVHGAQQSLAATAAQLAHASHRGQRARRGHHGHAPMRWRGDGQRHDGSGGSRSSA